MILYTSSIRNADSCQFWDAQHPEQSGILFRREVKGGGNCAPSYSARLLRLKRVLLGKLFLRTPCLGDEGVIAKVFGQSTSFNRSSSYV